jgi:hypothetical protein
MVEIIAIISEQTNIQVRGWTWRGDVSYEQVCHLLLQGLVHLLMQEQPGGGGDPCPAGRHAPLARQHGGPGHRSHSGSHSGGQSYSYKVTPLRNKLLF